MLFLLKRFVATSLAALAILVLAGLGLRQAVPRPVPLEFGAGLVLLGVALCSLVLVSDALLHGAALALFGPRYFHRFKELATVFGQQSYAAMVCGALQAGIGEELVFRGLSLSPTVLLPLAVLFGLLHHVRGALWPFTLWSIWEGVLFALAVLYTGELLPAMIAHFLHDLLGFLIFRRVNRTAPA